MQQPNEQVPSKTPVSKKEIQVCAVIAIALIVTSIVTFASTRASSKRFWESAVQTEAVVVDVVRRGSRDSDSATVRFTTAAGRELTARLRGDLGKAANLGIGKGRTITVWYDPDNPANVRATKSTHRHFTLFIWFTGFLGVVVLGSCWNYYRKGLYY